jgi:hypothetical protein
VVLVVGGERGVSYTARVVKSEEGGGRKQKGLVTGHMYGGCVV